jgi:hypothetical protein
MNKVYYILTEMLALIKEHRIYILAPILIMLGLLSILVYYVGPTVIVTFIYAGV